MMFHRKANTASSTKNSSMIGVLLLNLLLLSTIFCDAAAASFVIESSSSSRPSAVTTTSWGSGCRTAGTTISTFQQQHGRLRRLLRLNLGPAEAWSAYNDALESSPLLTKSITASVILGAADLAGQSLEKVRKQQQQAAGTGVGGAAAEEADAADSIDWPRAIRFAIFGLVLQAPWNHYYYLALDGQIPPTPEPFTPTNGIKVLIDQFIQAPIFTVLIFIFLGVLEGKSTKAIEAQLKNDYKETILANWKLWVPATMINIGFVPPLFRVLYLNCVFFFWSIYLSLVLNKSEEPEAE